VNAWIAILTVLFLGGRQSYAISSIWLQVCATDTDGGGWPAWRACAAATVCAGLGSIFSPIRSGATGPGLVVERRDTPDWSRSRAVIFAAGAPFSHSDPALNANTLSPSSWIGGYRARAAFYGSGVTEPLLDNPQGRCAEPSSEPSTECSMPHYSRFACVCSPSATLPTRWSRRPACEDAGPLDCLLSLGAHEYPFSLADVRHAGVTAALSEVIMCIQAMSGIPAASCRLSSTSW